MQRTAALVAVYFDVSMSSHTTHLCVQCDTHTSAVVVHFSSFTETGVLVPRFRWRRSRWGRFCPVQLAEGNMVTGKMEFSVG